MGFPIASPGGGWHREAWIKRVPGLARLGSRGNSPGAPCWDPRVPAPPRAPPLPALSPQPRWLPGFVVRCAAGPLLGGVVTSMCRQQPKVERACRASPEIALQCHVCVCALTPRERSGRRLPRRAWLMFSCFCFSLQDNSFSSTAVTE